MNIKLLIDDLAARYNSTAEFGANTLFVHVRVFSEIKAELERLWRIEECAEAYREACKIRMKEQPRRDALFEALEVAKVQE